MAHRVTPLPLLLLLAPGGLGCGTKLDPGGSCPVAPAPVTFATVQQQVLSTCTPCHSAKAGNRFGAPTSVNFDTYEDAVAHASAANMDIVSGRMPPAAALAADTACTFDAWVKNRYAR